MLDALLSSCGDECEKMLEFFEKNEQYITLRINTLISSSDEVINILSDKGIKVINKAFYNEFTVEVTDAEEFLNKLKSKNIIGGIKIDDNKVLICVTEMNTTDEIAEYIKAI